MLLFELTKLDCLGKYLRISDYKFSSKTFKLIFIFRSELDIDRIVLQDVETFGTYTIYREELSFWTICEIQIIS